MLGDFNLPHPLWSGPSRPTQHQAADQLLDVVRAASMQLTLPSGCHLGRTQIHEHDRPSVHDQLPETQSAALSHLSGDEPIVRSHTRLYQANARAGAERETSQESMEASR